MQLSYLAPDSISDIIFMRSIFTVCRIQAHLHNQIDTLNPAVHPRILKIKQIYLTENAKIISKQNTQKRKKGKYLIL